jgi:hypothetical protein
VLRVRLVVIVLKASEDFLTPVEAVDYWLRVRHHLGDGGFPSFGYFAGVELDPQPPLIELAVPGLRFHRATDMLLRYWSPEIHLTQIGLNENWRRGPQVVSRQ